MTSVELEFSNNGGRCWCCVANNNPEPSLETRRLEDNKLWCCRCIIVYEPEFCTYCKSMYVFDDDAKGNPCLMCYHAQIESIETHGRIKFFTPYDLLFQRDFKACSVCQFASSEEGVCATCTLCLSKSEQDNLKAKMHVSLEEFSKRPLCGTFLVEPVLSEHYH